MTKYLFISSDEPNTVLGLKWCNSQDTFSFDSINPDSSIEVISTKRSILSVIAKIFYPLGLISPFVARYGKILFQELWKLSVSWDQEVPSDLKLKFQRWLLSTQSFKSFHIERCYYPQEAWGKLSHVELSCRWWWGGLCYVDYLLFVCYDNLLFSPYVPDMLWVIFCCYHTSLYIREASGAFLRSQRYCVRNKEESHIISRVRGKNLRVNFDLCVYLSSLPINLTVT